MATSYQKTIKKIRKQAEEQGWREKEKDSGWMLLAPDKENKVLIHKTASDRRALANILSEMRKYGFVWQDR